MRNLCSVLNREADAVAIVRGSKEYPNIWGKVRFYSMQNSVMVRTEISGLPQNSDPCRMPIFAFHIHGGTACSGNNEDPFADAGSHYDLNGCPHPYHAGDMPPLFGVKGNAFSVFVTDRFTLSEVISRVVIIHEHPDDFMTQPSGNSGKKIACGIIKPAARKNNCNRCL